MNQNDEEPAVNTHSFHRGAFVALSCLPPAAFMSSSPATPVILHLDEIKRLVSNVDVTSAMAEGFRKYSEGKCVVPPVGELIFDDPAAPGDVHIKYGYVKKDEFYVVKIASGFYENPKLGLSSCQGLMLLFKQRTGELASVLLDEGHLTDLRTAAAGAVAAKYFAPRQIQCIGIVGCGIQAKLQLFYLREIVKCRTVLLWGRNKQSAVACKAELEKSGDWNVTVTDDISHLAKSSQLIVTTTPSEKALLEAADDIQPGVCQPCLITEMCCVLCILIKGEDVIIFVA